MPRTLVISIFLAVALMVSLANASPPTAVEQRDAARWVAGRFSGESEPVKESGLLAPKLKSGRLLKNMATTKVYHKEIGALPLKIAAQRFKRGLQCPSVGSVVVRLPSAGKKLNAVFGVDSNRVESFYSNAGRGRVIGGVEIDGEEVFRSPVMREGMAGVTVAVDLDGATEFTLTMKDAGGVVERVDFNQADWAAARVEMADGQIVWLGDLPIAPVAAPPPTKPPFSFVYGGRHSDALLTEWRRKSTVKSLSQQRREHVVQWLDPDSGLEVRLAGIEYLDFPVVEWKLLFKNNGAADTPILEDIRPLDVLFERDNEGEFQLRHGNGSPHSLVKMSDVDDYAPRQTTLRPQFEHVLGSKIGLPASNDLPFFNIEANRRGRVVAIGWPGQWQARLARDAGRALHLTAGQELTHFKLLPGEEVRSPLIAMLFWRDDWLHGQNVWRRWMVAHNLPRTGDGKLPLTQHAASSSAYYMESTGATEANQKMFIDRYLDVGIKPDYWWIDAGWYSYQDYWLNVGTWRPDAKRFPRGLRPIADHLHDRDVKMILWFTPECVARGSHIDRAHPEFLLKGGAEWWMGHALIQGEVAGHVNDSGLTVVEDVAAFGMGNPTSTVTGKTRLTDGEWHLVTATRAIDKERQRSVITLYIDGRLEASGSTPNTEPLDANDSWGVGRQYQTRGVAGEIDDVRIFDSALSQAEVRALHSHSSRKTPAAHYSFDDTMKDEVGSRHGERIGTGELEFVRGATRRAMDRSLRFENNYGVKIPNHVPNDFTLSCWVRMESVQPPPWGRGDLRLFDFSNPAAVDWMTDHIDAQLKQQRVDFYRHDGIPPLAYWRANDEPDRQGITEIKHIEGLLRYWDELKRRHPMLRIDICSGGGSRNELETLRRAVPLWRSDYAYEPTGMQTLTYGMALWIPYFGTGVNASDAYTFRSQMAPAIATSWDVRRRDTDYAFRRRMLTQFRAVAPHYYGDYYPLTTYRVDDDVWMAWQFDRPDRGSGVVQAFRRPNSPATVMQFPLRGLDREAIYSVRNLDDDRSVEITGEKLTEAGLVISLSKRRSAAIVVYKRKVE